MNSQYILIIFNVLGSLRALVLDSVMDETCIRQKLVADRYLISKTLKIIKVSLELMDLEQIIFVT